MNSLLVSAIHQTGSSKELAEERAKSSALARDLHDLQQGGTHLMMTIRPAVFVMQPMDSTHFLSCGRFFSEWVIYFKLHKQCMKIAPCTLQLVFVHLNISCML